MIGNLVYGFWIESYGSKPDWATRLVTDQSAVVLRWFGENTSFEDDLLKPTTMLTDSGMNVLSVYEGCNGINVMIVFLAFLLAFGKPDNRLLWLVPSGLVLIHIFNIGRIVLLYYVTTNLPRYFYFTHKYLFTAIIYIAVFIIWVIWVRMVLAKSKAANPTV